MWNLRNRILVPILVAVLLGVGALVLFSYNFASTALYKAAAADAIGSTDDMTDQVQFIVSGAVTDASQIAGRSAAISLIKNPGSDSAREELTALFGKMKELRPTYQTLGVLDATGKILACSHKDGVGASFAERDFFKDSMKGGTGHSTVPQQSKLSGLTDRWFYALSRPVYDGKDLIGAVYISIDLTEFNQEVVSPRKVGHNGYGFILDSNGNFIGYKNDPSKIMDKELKSSAPIAASIADLARTNPSKKKGFIFTQFKGEDVYYFYERDDFTGWYSVMRAGASDFLSASIEMRTWGIAFGLFVVVAASLLTWFIVRSVTGALLQGVTFAEAVAKGDLEQTLNVHRNDELGTLSNALRSMVGKLKDMVLVSGQKTVEATEQSEKASVAMQEAEVARRAAESAKSEGLRHAGESLAVLSTRLVALSDALAEQIQQATKGADTQRMRTGETATAMEEMNSTVYEVARNAGSAAEAADDARKNAEDGAKVVANVVAVILEVDAKTTVLKQSLNQLGERANSIGQIMSVITDIADQTNLLALNAAIEAARAGEAGRGFAVVADEVRKLAEKTMQATKEVGQAVRVIQTGTRDNIQGMEEATASVSKSTSLAREAGESLSSIVHIVESTADKVRSIATASEEQSAASEQISRGTEEINRIADETASFMGKASQAMDRLGELVKRIGDLERDLKNA